MRDLVAEEEEALAVVQDHREDVEVDESLTVQPRALLTVGNPMANRPKLHFGYLHPQHQALPGQHPVPAAYQMPQQRPGYPQTRPIGYHVPVAPARKGTGVAVVVVGILIGLIGVVLVLSQLADKAGSGGGKLAEPVTEGSAVASSDDVGWEEPEAERLMVGAGVALAEEAEIVRPPVFSLSALEDRPFERYSVNLPDGVKLVDSEFGGAALRFGAGAKGVELSGIGGIDFGGSISVAAWIRIKPSTSERLIFARKNADGMPIYMKVIPQGEKFHGCVVFGCDGLDPSSVRTSSRTPIDDGEWHFVMGMHDQEKGDLRIYLDGKRSSSRPGTVKCKGTLEPLSGSVMIGAGDFSGDIYGLRIYDWALRTADMEKVYNRRK